jgi:peptide/nickel transport system ATP-binding protein
MFVTHDLAVVAHLADEIAVMYLGRLMEVGTRDQVLAPPYHPYTEALLSACPSVDTGCRRDTIRLAGDMPSPVDLPTGCPFHSRCPRLMGAICRDQIPAWQHDGSGHAVACHIPLDRLAATQKSLFGTSDPSHRGER